MSLIFMFGDYTGKPTPWGMIHSEECSLTLHGESLVGKIKVRYDNGEKTYFEDCCKGVATPVLEIGDNS